MSGSRGLWTCETGTWRVRAACELFVPAVDGKHVFEADSRVDRRVDDAAMREIWRN